MSVDTLRYPTAVLGDSDVGAGTLDLDDFLVTIWISLRDPYCRFFYFFVKTLLLVLSLFLSRER